MAKSKERVKKLETKFSTLAEQVAAVVGIGAIVIGDGAVIWSAISSLK